MRLQKSNKQRMLIALYIVLLSLLLAACGIPRSSTVNRIAPGGDASAGRQHIINYGCGACHTISGIVGANATVGPPLTRFEQRHYIAGQLPNNAANLISWIQNPQHIDPDTAMPNLGITEAEARDIAAYLYNE